MVSDEQAVDPFWKGWKLFTFKLGGGFKAYLFLSLLGEMIQFDSYFQKGAETTN